MAREAATKASADNTAKIPEERPIAPGSGTNNLFHPPIQVPIPPHRSGSRWSPLPSGTPAYFSPFQSLQYRTPILRPLFASQLDDVAFEQVRQFPLYASVTSFCNPQHCSKTVPQPSATSSNYPLTPTRGVYASSGLVLPNSSMPVRSQSDANAVTTAPVSVRRCVVCPVVYH